MNVMFALVTFYVGNSAMEVTVEDDALTLMNDSDFGLTTSIWTADMAVAESLSEKQAIGTCFVDRCDNPDLGFALTSAKNTCRGCSLSTHDYYRLTRLQSYHCRPKGIS